MNHFERRNGILCAEDVPLPNIAQQFGTPTYVYSRATLTRHVKVLQEGLAKLPHLLCYAVKANGNLAILELLKSLGCGFDAVSVGELARILKTGVSPDKIIVSGVGKRDDEIAAAIFANVQYICVESREELQAVAEIAAAQNRVARVGVRVNPDVDAKTHPYIATGLKENKFGVPIDAAPALFAEGLTKSSLQMVGVSCHIGSQITTVEPFCDAARRMVRLVGELRALGVPLEHVGLGGGLGVPYDDETPPSPAAYGQQVAEILAPLGLHVVFEPGRVIVGNAGLLLTRVVRIKHGADRTFVIVDAGMNDLLRPSLYDAYHRIEVVADTGEKTQPVDIVGPVCESADTFGKGRELPPVQAGDLLAIRTAGAYGMVMASTYNGRPHVAEVLCEGPSALLIRERDSLADLWRHERHLDGTEVNESIPGW